MARSRTLRAKKGRKFVRKELTKEAATVEEAVASAAQELGIPAEELTVEVVKEASKKAFGLFGKGNAIVKVTYEAEDESDDTDEAPKAPAVVPEGDLSAAATAAKNYLVSLLEALGAGDTALTVEETEDGWRIDLEGEQEGLIIGRRGETLDSLQYLTGLVANRQQKEYYRVTLNVGNYREKREKSLTGLAHKYASAVARTGRRRTLEPMNPYERRIIHTAVQDIEGATSWSEGKEPNRHVIIGPTEDNKNARRGGGRGNRGGNRNRSGKGHGSSAPKFDENDVYMRYSGSIAADRPMREFVSRTSSLPKADGSTPPEKTVSAAEESSDLKLYGRIDL